MVWTTLSEPISLPSWHIIPSPAAPHGRRVCRMTQPQRRRRVLIVEDEPALRLSYERAFQPRYDLVFASTGAEAMSLLAEHKPDVAVLDIRLPGTAGVGAPRNIRISPPELPGSITTAHLSIEPP